MSLSYSHQRQLRLIEAGLRRSDPSLAAIMGIFGRLYPDQDLPAWEHPLAAPSGQGHLRRAAAWILAALATTIVAITVVLSKAATTTVGWREPDRERTHPGREPDEPGRS